MLDHHVQIAVQGGFARYTTTFETFEKLFLGFPFINDKFLLPIYNAIKAKPPHFREGYGLGTGELPLIAFELLEGVSDVVPMGGHVGFDDEGNRLEGFVGSQTVLVTLAAKDPNMTRVLSLFVIGLLTLARRAIVRQGYPSFAYEGLDPLSPEEALIAEGAGVRVRRQRWRSLVEYSFGHGLDLDGDVSGGVDWDVRIAGSDTDPEEPRARPVTGEE